ncbi:MAG: hypothetical protein M1814_003142 [Vezdaea aestivalis]|nr:MAG: hypothetical protein M1814_003142 [Vezdaea aestivalis]
MYLESVPEVVQLSASKPRLSSANSESSLSHFANGVHKSYKYMNRGPYSIPRSHTISYPLAAHRSTDSLPATSGSASLAQIKDTFARNQDIRLVRSEHGSPHSSGISTLDHLDSHMPQLDLSYPAYATAQGNRPPPLDMSNISAPPPLDHFVATPDTDQPMYSAGLNGPHIDWSTFDIGYEGNHHGMPTSAPYVQSHSYPGFENSYMAHRAMTASSTGDASDVEDFPAFDSNPVHAPGLLYTQFPSDSSEVCESDYRMSEPPYIGLGSSTMLTSNNLESHDFDSFVLKGAGANQFETRSVGGDSAVSAHSHQAAFDVQKFAPTSAPTTTATFTMPITSAESSAPYWIPQYDSVSASLSPENEPIAESTAVWAN